MPPKFLTTSKIAQAVNVHPNTVRYYEQCGYLPQIPRTPSGYRRFSETHLDQMRLAHLALQGPFPGGRSLVESLVKKSAANDLGGALELAFAYLARVRGELIQADAAIEFLERWAQGSMFDFSDAQLRIKDTARLLDLTPDMLRNWERNGLLSVPRDPSNGYRQYGADEIGRLRVIRMLRLAGYSMMAVLRMLRLFDQDRQADLRQALNTPLSDDDILSAGDTWHSTLKAQERRALNIIAQLETMIDKRRGPKYA
ncbi:MerR family DNA-binding transcriptional regulator [Aggregatilinea lenta]|uniref:MerR family DNA-binding transcriptional regulator n=1 Tax=Aggregatilinea lenta TaxID=913108 RepID=UPI000E5B4AC3|nr:MerR family DNA-binding transcriptional regulator [Aggregatilinea lenta]